MQTLRKFMFGLRRRFARISLTILAVAAGALLWPTIGQTQSSGGSGLGQVIQNVLNGQPAQIQQILQGATSGSGSPVNPQVSVTPSSTAQTTTIPVAGGPQPQPGQSAPGMSGVAPSTTASTTTPPPATPSGPPQTHLEKIMSDRAGVALSLFGYDQVGSGEAASVPAIAGIPSDYILGPGDQLNISMRGQGSTSNDYHVTVDRDGHVILPGVAPVPAAGRPLGDFITDMASAVRKAYVGTDTFVTVAQLRQISVMVVGQVNTPGMRAMTALSSPLDAILVSGGIQRTGSLRNIHIIRNGQSINYDLYNILTQIGHGRQILLQDGDRIVVSPLGPTMAVVGWVRKPGIYELAPGSSGMSAREFIALSGGLEVRGAYKLSALRVERDGRQVMQALNGMGDRVGDSDILFVQPGADQAYEQTVFAGGQNMAGRYSATGHSGKLSQLLREPGALGNTPYPLFGVISRRDPHTYLRTLIAFSPVAIIAGRDDIQLQSDDIVRVFSTDEIKLLDKAVQDFQSQVQQTTDQSHSLGQAANGTVTPQLLNTTNQGPTASTPLPTGAQQTTTLSSFDVSKETIIPTNPVASNVSVSNFGDLATQLSVDSLVLINFVIDHQANIDGAVRGPGSYILGPGTTLADLVAAAGGTQNWTDESGVQLTSTVVDRTAGTAVTKKQTLPLQGATLASYIVQPQDDFRFNRVYTIVNAGQVDLEGEIRSPGSYQVTHGERLSELLIAAGGLTDTAYPYGTVYLRKSIAATESVGYQRVADQLQTQLLVGLGQVSATGSTSFSPDAIAGMEALINQLRSQTPVGRVSFIADPSILAAHPDRDPLLEPGDVIFVPQRPSTVTVLGEVMQPGSYAFSEDKSATDYITEAGGYGRYSDSGYTFIVYPDGTANEMNSSWISFDSAKIPPGSVIFVPKDILPINWILLSTTMADILKDFAVSAASLAVLHQK
jgi:polysaccharide export outer membrane protein